VYRLCAGVMAVCVACAIVRVVSRVGEIFWFESVALWAFAISWMVKGRAGFTAKPALGRRKVGGGAPVKATAHAEGPGAAPVGS
jgi:hypothetical protein